VAAGLVGWYVGAIAPTTTSTLLKPKLKPACHSQPHRYQSSTCQGVAPLVLPLVAACLHLSTLLRFFGLHHHSVLTTSVTTIPSRRRLARAFSTIPLRRHGVLLHCRPTINHRILPKLHTILLPKQQLPVQHLIIVM